MPDGGRIARAVPRGANIIYVREGRHAACRRDPSHLTDVHSNEIDQPVLDQRGPFTWMVEQFAHRLWRRTLFTDVPEPLDVFRGECVLEEEELVGFEVLGKLDGVDRSKPFVNVVKKFDFGADLCSDVFDHIDHQPTIFAWMVVSPFG